MARNVSVRLDADVTRFVAGMRQAQQATRDLATRTGLTEREVTRAQRGMDQAADRTRAARGRLLNGAGLAGAALAAGIGVAVRKAADFDAAMSKVAASGEDAQQNISTLRAEAVKMGAETSFSAGEAAAGIENLAKAGVSAKDIMGGGLKGSLDLAAAGQIAVADAAEIAATAMTQFNLQGGDIPHVADLLAAGAGKAQGSVADMGAALKQSGLIASQFGLSLEETTGVLAAFADSGLIGSDAGTSFKTMLQRLTNPSADAAGTMAELGIQVSDAEGNMLGAAEVAQELQDALGGMTEAQRNATLAQLFGSDAVRGATVFMQQGAKGMQKYIDQTNDVGYASRSAAILLDNLKGDMEALSGSFETAMIGLGEGADAPLRQLVQRATEVVNAFNGLSAGTKSTVLEVAAIGSGALLGIAGLGKLTVGINNTRGALADLAVSSPKSAGLLRGLGAAGLIAAAGFIALKVAGAGINKLMGDGSKSLGDAEQALVSLGDSATGAAYNMDEFISVQTKGDLVPGAKGIDNLGEAYDRLFNKSATQKANDWATGLVSSVTGVKGEAQLLEDRFEALDTSLLKLSVGGSADKAAEGFRKAAAALKEQGASTEEILTLFPTYHEELKKSAAAQGVSNLSSEEYVAWMGGKVPAAIQQTIDKTKEVKAPTVDMGKALDGAADALERMVTPAKASAEALDDLTKSIFAEGAAALGLADKHAGFEAAIDNVSKAVKENGRTLDVTTEKGRANGAALRALASSAQAYIQDQITLGKGTKEVGETTAQARREFIAAARDMGRTQSQAEKLADKYGLIPKKVTTKLELANQAAAKKQVDDFKKALAKLPKSVAAKIQATYDRKGPKAALKELRAIEKKIARAKIVVTSNAAQAARDAQTKMNQVQSIRRSITVTSSTGQQMNKGLKYGATGGQFTHAGVIHRSTGGAVWGAGTTSSDSILARLSNNEYVQRASAVDKYGVQFMRALNNLQIDPKELPRFAVGGSTNPRDVTERRYAAPGPRPSAGGGADLAQAIAGLSSRKGDVNLTINHPQAEPTSKTIATAAGYLGI